MKTAKRISEKIRYAGILSHILCSFVWQKFCFLLTCWIVSVQWDSLFCILLDNLYLYLILLHTFLWVFIGLQCFQPTFHSASCSFMFNLAFHPSHSHYPVYLLFFIENMFQWMITPCTLILVGVLYVELTSASSFWNVLSFIRRSCFILSTQLTLVPGRNMAELCIMFLLSGCDCMFCFCCVCMCLLCENKVVWPQVF